MQNKPQSLTKSLYPWLVWLLAASFMYYKYLIQVSPGVMSKQLMSAYSLTGAGLGNLAACFFYGYLLMQIPVGILLDRWSPGKITTIAVSVCALGVALFAHTHTLLTAGLSRFLIGLSAAFAAVSCFKLISIWFAPKRFAFMSGLSMTAAMLGAVGGQRPLAALINKYEWRESLEIIAVAGFALALLIWIVVRDKYASRIVQSTANKEQVNTWQNLKFILQDKQTWLLSFYSGLAFAPVSVFGGLWGVPFIETAYGLNVSQAAECVAYIFIGFAVGCPLMGWLSDYIGKRKPLMYFGTFLSLGCLAAVLYLPVAASYLSMVLFFFGIGASGFFICFAMIREIHSLLITGTVLGFMNTFDSVCEAVTEPFVGRLLDLSWRGEIADGVRKFALYDYHQSLSVLCLYLSCAIILLFFIRETNCESLGA